MLEFNISSVIGAVVLFFGSEIARFLLKDWLERNRSSLQRAINWRLFIVLFDVGAIGFLVWFAFFLLNTSAVPQRRDILLGMGMNLVLIVLVLNFFDDLRSYVKLIQAPGVAGPSVPPSKP